MKVEYWISGRFYPGMIWEDFFPAEDIGLPRFTITVEPSPSSEIMFDFELDNDPKNEEDWYDAIVSPALTPESAKAVIAAVLEIDVDQVEIVELNVSDAI